ncbi:hypothetical protein C2S53_014626 [Perilla frutescens var. hirtella]|uniref:DOG1 domain-containing protein n=1 Tax=Perilla frutescens var. hirtella TaxID=608512 RepID=A0AAD4PCW6_PERFH|nr:hypothetical protein C2S51_038225 [Perilla frutescens var. frutescens]KAH6835283.1 hypothetical protein C2S53_014626 [Perilla frutescens var. hirtella]
MGNETQDNFEEFYREWRDEQKQQLDNLVFASNNSQPPQTDSSSLSVLVAGVVAHYERYYKTKSKCAKADVLLLLSPPWTTSLEDAFIWVGGWRPTTAFHLLYSKSGLQFVAKFEAVESGAAASPIDLGDLSSEQVHLIDTLQRRTIVEERKISEKLAKQQERVADAEMVELSHDVNELSRVEGDDTSFVTGRIKSTLKLKEEGFHKILQSADDLRLGTIKAVVDILTPMQAVHFLIAAAELQLSLRDWGREKEEREASSQAVA